MHGNSVGIHVSGGSEEREEAGCDVMVQSVHEVVAYVGILEVECSLQEAYNALHNCNICLVTLPTSASNNEGHLSYCWLYLSLDQLC